MLFDREVDLDLFLFLTSSIILHLDVVVVVFVYGLLPDAHNQRWNLIYAAVKQKHTFRVCWYFLMVLRDGMVNLRMLV